MDYNILDFSDPEAFDVQFERLVGGIVEFYPAARRSGLPRAACRGGT